MTYRPAAGSAAGKNVTYCSAQHNEVADPVVAAPAVVVAVAVLVLVARAAQEKVVSRGVELNAVHLVVDAA